MPISGIDHVQVAMPQGGETEARAFYGGLLGLLEIAKPAALAARGGLWFAVGGQQLHLGVEGAFRPARKAHPAFLVEDLGTLRERMVAAGLAPVGDDRLQSFRRFHIADPFGNRLEFVESLAEEAPPAALPSGGAALR